MSERAVAFRPAALAELLAARRWYDRERRGLGDAFALEVDRTMDLIQQSPDLFPTVHRDVRRAIVRRFPYGIFYRVGPAAVIILSVSHLRRNPRRWQSRG